MSEQRIRDIATLAQSALLSTLPMEEVGLLLGQLAPVTLSQGGVLEPAGGSDLALHVVLEGELESSDGQHQPRRLGPGDVIGETALAGTAGHERVLALSESRLAKLSATAYAALSEAQPRAALHLAQGALRLITARLESTPAPPTGPASAPCAERTPRVAGSAGHGPDDTARVAVASRLPRELDGALVVAGRAGEHLLSLHALSVPDAVITPITTSDWEGRDIYRRSAGLALLEAARQLGMRLQLGPSITSGRLVFVPAASDRAALARSLDERLRQLCQAEVPFREELWSVHDALEIFRRQEDPSACLLLEDSLEPVTTLVRCGDTWANVARPLLPHAGLLEGTHVLEHPLGLLLDFGPRIRRSLPRRAVSTVEMELHAPRYGAPMTRREAEWLTLLGVDSVGTFNQVCVRGKVGELIRVSEGFHEKRVAEIADQVERTAGARIVAVAGPSSSGKTTFIKRLLVQLRVNGIEPCELSLDDYYLDRARQARDARGELDFEALEALDVASLRADLEALSSGAAVRPPRYDFQHGLSRARAGEELRLGERGVLLVEGIHALNPALYGSTQRPRPFNVFIHPATSLPFDRLSTLEPADVRLLRRIVRDRHQRGFATSETLARWQSVRRAERLHIFPFQAEADAVFDSSLIYEVSVLRVYAERYLLEVPRSSAEAPSARRLRALLRSFVPIHPEHVPPTSLLREFIGGSGFTY